MKQTGMNKILVLAFCLFMLNGCSFTPETKKISFRQSHDSGQSSGLRLIYRKGLLGNSNFVAGIVFMQAEWIEYYLDGRLAARHQLFEQVDTLVYLDSGEHSLVIKSVFVGLITLGQRTEEIVAKYRFDLKEGQVGTFTTSAIPGEYTSNMNLGGFKNVQYWEMVERGKSLGRGY